MMGTVYRTVMFEVGSLCKFIFYCPLYIVQGNKKNKWEVKLKG
jgi:Zn-finger protein